MNTGFENSIIFKIGQTANSLNYSLNHILQPFNLTVEQRVTLEYIKKEKKVNQTKIAKVLAKDKTTISRMLRTLNKKQYIKKEEDSIDGRTNLISLTILGEKALNESIEDVTKFREEIFNKLNEEERVILDTILRKIVNN